MQALAKLGCTVYLIAGNFKKEDYSRYPDIHMISIPIKYFPVVSPILYGLTLFLFMPFYLLKIRPDFVIADTHTVPFLILVPILSKLIGCKLIVDIRSTPVVTNFRTDVSFRVSVLLAKKSFDGMTIVTPMMKEEICKSYGINPNWVYVLPNGVSESFLKTKKSKSEVNRLKKQLGLMDKFVIMYHGSLDRLEKGGLIESIQALTFLVTEYPDIALFFLGSMKEQTRATLNKIIEENNLKQNVVLHDPVSYSEVPKYILMSDLGLVPLPNIPIWRHQQPLKLLEYLAVGKVVIVADSPAHRFIVGDNKNGIYFSAVSPNSISRAIKYAYENKDKLDKWGKIGRKIIEERYTWESVGKELLEYLLKIEPKQLISKRSVNKQARA